jgi:hypothetical protein
MKIEREKESEYEKEDKPTISNPDIVVYLSNEHDKEQIKVIIEVKAHENSTI